ncbi:MAG: DUF2937 family protein [Porticoccaceae bacterium]|nr:DUF2937 family protein [Porticoccaceae bacterium]
MNVVHHYASLVIFTAAFLVGVQIPNFVDQYDKRVDAHLIEASEHLSGYQSTADIYHGGDLEVLIQKHRNSSDPTFRSETAVIENLTANHARFVAEQKALKGSLFSTSIHVMFFADGQIRGEVLDSYTSTLPINTDAIFAGLLIAFLSSLLLESVLALLRSVGVKAMGGGDRLMPAFRLG